MAINIEELRRLAQAATPGPWKMVPVGDGRQKFAVADSEFLSILTVTDEGGATFGTVYDDADAKFIAAANPAAISELLDRLEAAESARRDDYQNWVTALDRNAELLAKLEAAEKERDGLRQCFNVWIDKTEWVQRGINEGTISPKYLGLHRADVMASLLGAAEKERDALRDRIEVTDEVVRELERKLSTGMWRVLQEENEALRAKIEQMERQEPVAWMSSRNGFICKENKNPDYNVPLKRFDLGAQTQGEEK